jgi:hypothetical protein
MEEIEDLNGAEKVDSNPSQIESATSSRKTTCSALPKPFRRALVWIRTPNVFSHEVPLAVGDPGYPD